MQHAAYACQLWLSGAAVPVPGRRRRPASSAAALPDNPTWQVPKKKLQKHRRATRANAHILLGRVIVNWILVLDYYNIFQHD